MDSVWLIAPGKLPMENMHSHSAKINTSSIKARNLLAFAWSPEIVLSYYYTLILSDDHGTQRFHIIFMKSKRNHLVN